jgi:hypothetical protein
MISLGACWQAGASAIAVKACGWVPPACLLCCGLLVPCTCQYGLQFYTWHAKAECLSCLQSHCSSLLPLPLLLLLYFEGTP